MMRILRRPTLIVLALTAIGWLGFFLWYRGDRAPLRADERQAYLSRIEALEGPASDFLDPDRFAELLAGDDGDPYYVVNLFKIRPRAAYTDGRTSDASGSEAFGQFSRAALPVWLRRGTHPVFVSALGRTFESDWDLVSVVRYRSRRDYAEIVTSEAFLAALPHRLAATEENLRLQLPGRLLPSPVVVVLLFGAVLVGVATGAEKLIRVRQSRAARLHAAKLRSIRRTH